MACPTDQGGGSEYRFTARMNIDGIPNVPTQQVIKLLGLQSGRRASTMQQPQNQMLHRQDYHQDLRSPEPFLFTTFFFNPLI